MKKKVLLSLLSVALIVTVSVGATMALLRDTTDEVVNTFTSDKAISISLREPKWDGYGFEKTTLPSTEVLGEVTKISDTNYPKGTTAVDDDAKYGCNIASQYMPGDTIPKNPIVKNTSEDEKVYVAVTVECFRGQGTSAVSIPYGTATTDNSFVKDFGTLTFNEGTWTLLDTYDNKMVYVYGTANAATELDIDAVTSTSVFKEVVLNDNLGEETTVLPSFEVKVNAYAVQVKNVEADEAVEELKNFIHPN